MNIEKCQNIRAGLRKIWKKALDFVLSAESVKKTSKRNDGLRATVQDKLKL